MMRTILTVIISLLYLTTIGQDGVYYIRVGEDFSIKFIEHTLEQCSDEVYFSKINDSTYAFSQSLDYTDLAQIIKLKMKVEFDSVNVFAGYENRYGIIISETEGAIIYDGNDPGSFVFSGWREVKVLDANRKYSLHIFENGKGFVNNTAPKMDQSIVKKWCKTLDWCPGNPVSVFCSRMMVRVTVFINGQQQNYYLNFERRVGEC